ncbi:CheB methylesterase domain-containing protein [Sulfurospirillum sp. 1612]|uniref:CheB methylesterase domain-containing protein n=1 Tax=Sulfurospirillum sp. 1612 TaxID=3094835 RepID=UPI002F92B4E4
MNTQKLILIGASTGGPGQIEKIIKSLRPDFDAAMIIAQHMQEAYVSSFMDYLNNNTSIEILQARDGACIENKKIYLLSQSTQIIKKFSSLYFSKSTQPHTYSPNINVLFNSVVAFSEMIQVLCIILTGIGNDGAKGALNLYHAKAHCIAEAESSAIVYGMPKAAFELNPDIKQYDINQICDAINRF